MTSSNRRQTCLKSTCKFWKIVLEPILHKTKGGKNTAKSSFSGGIYDVIIASDDPKNSHNWRLSISHWFYTVLGWSNIENVPLSLRKHLNRWFYTFYRLWRHVMTSQWKVNVIFIISLQKPFDWYITRLCWV